MSKLADDTKAVRKVANDADQQSMQTDIDLLVQWSDTWQMLFNADKCKVMHIGRNNPGYHYTMGGYAPASIVLDAKSVEKDLGVLIHSSLKPHEQCTSAAKKENIV